MLFQPTVSAKGPADSQHQPSHMGVNESFDNSSSQHLISSISQWAERVLACILHWGHGASVSGCSHRLPWRSTLGLKEMQGKGKVAFNKFPLAHAPPALCSHPPSALSTCTSSAQMLASLKVSHFIFLGPEFSISWIYRLLRVDFNAKNTVHASSLSMQQIHKKYR